MNAEASGPRIAVVIVSFNTCELLRNCLRSVEAAARYGGMSPDVWVVDNASRDGSAEMVAAEFPHVHCLALGRNIGFTGGNNVALAALGFAATVPPDLRIERAAGEVPEFVLLLNPDAELTVGALKQMVRAMQRLPRAGVIGAHLQYGDGRFQHGAFRFPNLPQVALDLYPLVGVPGAHRLHGSAANGRYPAALWAQEEPFAVDFVLGAAMFVRGAAIAEIGALDPGFWMYCEEMDWCLRMRVGGWEVYAAPAVRVIHHEAQSSRQVRWGAYVRLWKSRFRFYEKHHRHYPPGYIEVVRRIVRSGVRRQQRTVEGQYARGELDGVAAGEALKALAIVAVL
jgi:GT2 family glycosyltransferase